MPRTDDDDDDDTPRSRRRPRDDDEDDAPPPRRRRSRDDDDFPPPRGKSKLPLILGILALAFLVVCGGGGFAIYYFFDSVVGEKRSQQESGNNLKQVGLALHNFNDTTGSFPTNSVGADGRPLLSWRVHILPYVEEQGLYGQFKLDEAWDGPNNRRLLDQMPRVYATPAERRGTVPKGNKTYYRGFSHPGALFAPRVGNFVPGIPRPDFRPSALGLGIGGITDGLSNTIAVVEAGDPVEWTKPDDLDLAPGRGVPKLGGVRPKADVFMVLMLDGSVRTVRRTVSESGLRAAVSVAGGEVTILD